MVGVTGAWFIIVTGDGVLVRTGEETVGRGGGVGEIFFVIPATDVAVVVDEFVVGGGVVAAAVVAGADEARASDGGIAKVDATTNGITDFVVVVLVVEDNEAVVVEAGGGNDVDTTGLATEEVLKLSLLDELRVGCEGFATFG